MRRWIPVFLGAGLAAALIASTATPSAAFFFSTGDPDGRMATGSRPEQPGILGIESADDFVLDSATSIYHATFTGLLTGGDVGNVGDVVVEMYHVFPVDSGDPPSGRVPTRANSPSDVALDSRDFSGGGLSFSATALGTFTAANSVLNGIFPLPDQFTGGEGPVTGTEVLFDVSFTSPFLLPADHYFFVPQVAMNGGEFYWLSAPDPIVPPGTPFTPDLQSWIRNTNLEPDWLRVGTDITHQGPFNAAFTLAGDALPPVPEPGSLALFGMGLAGLGLATRTRKAR